MPAPISVVIPTLNAARGLPAALAALTEGLSAGLLRELIVTDGGSVDATLRIAEAAGARIVGGAASRGGQLRRGCAVAAGDWLLVLHADTVLQAGWAREVAAHLPSGKPAAFRLSFDGNGAAAWLVARFANSRSRVGLPYGDQGLLVPRRVYENAGGYPDIPLMEDVALVRALPRTALLESVAMTSAERYRRDGWIRRGARNLWTLARYFAGVSPDRLARAYRR